MSLEEKVLLRIEVLKKELSDFVIQANTQVKAYQAAIGELESLLKSEEIKKPDKLT
jgi:hypothetical protein